MLVQLLLNRYSGGDTFFGPRLWIEPLALLAPLLARAVQTVWTERPGTMLIPAALIIGVVIHGIGAVLMPY